MKEPYSLSKINSEKEKLTCQKLSKFWRTNTNQSTMGRAGTMRKMPMPYLQSTPVKESAGSNLREDVHTVRSMDREQLITPIRKAIRIRVSKENLIRKRSTVLKESARERDTKICPKLNPTILENMAILHVTVHIHVIMPNIA